MLNPSDDLVDWILKTVPTMGAGWCPPGILGVGIGGTPEKAMLLAKEAIMAPVDIQELKARGAGEDKLARRKNCASNCTKRSMRSASARRASAA
jgi:fumarate hydratase class I